MLRHAATRPDYVVQVETPEKPRDHARELVRMIVNAGHKIEKEALRAMLVESLKRAFPILWSDNVEDADRKGLPAGLTREAQDNLVRYERKAAREQVVEETLRFKVAEIPSPRARSSRRIFEIRWG
jgi:hypothetical protein